MAFTLSRNRCDNNANMLSNIDLTTKEEKHHIRMFFKKSISRLKDDDQQLPQVRNSCNPVHTGSTDVSRASFQNIHPSQQKFKMFENKIIKTLVVVIQLLFLEVRLEGQNNYCTYLQSMILAILIANL